MSTPSDDQQQQQQQDRQLNRKSSKSRLSKQSEVEDEEPPVNAKTKPIMAPTSSTSGQFQVTSPPHQEDSQTVDEGQEQKIIIPETRVESFDELCSDEEKNLPNKAKFLVRSHAMCGDDDTKLNARSIEKQGSSKSSAASSLSRDSSNELYTDSTGINLEEFIVSTLHKNSRDREMLMQLEEDMTKFVLETNKTVYRFPPMSSYNRMLVHRIAAFFGLDHNVDQSGTAVVVTKSKSTRLPDSKFKDFIKSDIFTEESKRVLKRDVQSYEETRSDPSTDMRKARSFDEREEHYERTRARIFAQDSSSSAEGVIESPSSESMTRARPWSSTESSSEGGHVPMMRQQHFMPQKAYSYGGSPVFYRTEVPCKRVGVAGDVARENLQPMGLQCSPIMEVQQSYYQPNQPVIVALPSMAQVPPGAIVIHPGTGHPYLNPDGSAVYRHDVVGSAGPPSPASMSHFSGSPAPNVPACVMPSSVQDPVGISGQFQQMAIHPTAQGGGDTTAGSSTVYVNPPWAVPRLYTYVVPPQQGIESEGQSPVPPSSQSVLVSNPLCMQAAPVQYQTSVPYGYSQGQLVYTQAQGCPPSMSAQATYTQTTSPVYYPVGPSSHQHGLHQHQHLPAAYPISAHHAVGPPYTLPEPEKDQSTSYSAPSYAAHPHGIESKQRSDERKGADTSSMKSSSQNGGKNV